MRGAAMDQATRFTGPGPSGVAHALRRTPCQDLAGPRQAPAAPAGGRAARKAGGRHSRNLMKIITRDIPPPAAWALEQAGVHPLLARLYASRGVIAMEELDDALTSAAAAGRHEGAGRSRRPTGRCDRREKQNLHRGRL